MYLHKLNFISIFRWWAQRSRKHFRRIKNLKIFFWMQCMYVVMETLVKNCSSASRGPGEGAAHRGCFWNRPPLLALWIGNKILTTQLYSAREAGFMFTREVCNLRMESYLLLLKIKLGSETLHKEEKMPKSRAVARLGLLHRCDGYWCFLAVFTSPHSCEMFLQGISAPQSWVLKRNQDWEGTLVGMEVWKEGHRIKSNGRAERKTPKKTLYLPCAIKLVLNNRQKCKRNVSFTYLWLFLGDPSQREKSQSVRY